MALLELECAKHMLTPCDQTQSPCAAKSSTIQQFNATIIISYWRIWIDPPTNKAHLHLFAHDGMPYNKMILRYADPDVESHMQALETILKVRHTCTQRYEIHFC